MAQHNPDHSVIDPELGDLTQLPPYSEIDFKLLAKKDEAFKKIWQKHSGRLDFQDPETLKALTAAILSADAGLPAWPPAVLSATLVALLATERLAAGIREATRSNDRRALWFPAVHLVRDAAWAAAIVVWLARRLTRTASRPAHSMAHAVRRALSPVR